MNQYGKLRIADGMEKRSSIVTQDSFFFFPGLDSVGFCVGDAVKELIGEFKQLCKEPFFSGIS